MNASLYFAPYFKPSNHSLSRFVEERGIHLRWSFEPRPVYESSAYSRCVANDVAWENSHKLEVHRFSCATFPFGLFPLYVNRVKHAHGTRVTQHDAALHKKFNKTNDSDYSALRWLFHPFLSSSTIVARNAIKSIMKAFIVCYNC